MVWYGIAQHNLALYDMVYHNMAWYGVECHVIIYQINSSEVIGLPYILMPCHMASISRLASLTLPRAGVAAAAVRASTMSRTLNRSMQEVFVVTKVA